MSSTRFTCLFSSFLNCNVQVSVPVLVTSVSVWDSLSCLYPFKSATTEISQAPDKDGQRTRMLSTDCGVGLEGFKIEGIKGTFMLFLIRFELNHLLSFDNFHKLVHSLKSTCKNFN